MRCPDFFIIGAPKCGTTALYTYLSAHPRLFMPEYKEPHFFSTDFPGYGIDSAADYAALFAPAGPDQLTGEASVRYLYSRVAVARILEANPGARVLVLLRNPVDMVQAVHAQACTSLLEDRNDFWDAWAVRAERRAGRCLPPGDTDPRFLDYEAICTLAPQLERVWRHVPEEQRLVLFFDDFARDPGAAYRRVLAFLGVEDDGRTAFERVNANQVPRSRLVHRLARTVRALRHTAPLRAAQRVTHALGLQPLQRLHAANQRPGRRRPFTPEERRRLLDVFLPDIEATERLLGVSLDAWK